MSRPSVPNLLFDYYLKRFIEGEWKIRKSLIAHTGPDRDMAEIESHTRTVILYPVVVGERDDPPAKNLFHEILLHEIGLGFGPEIDKPNPDGKRIEDWWWKQLSTRRKARLAKLLE